MHAIMSCATASSYSSYSDAGRRPPAKPTFTTPIRSLHIAADDLQAALGVQVINPAMDTPVAASPVPLQHKRARVTQEDLVLADQAAFLKHIRTLDRLEALGMLEGRTPRPLRDDLIFDWWSWSWLQYGRYLNRVDALAVLEGKKTCRAQEELATLEHPVARSSNKNSGDDSIMLAESEVSCLKRAKAINKRAGRDILKRRESRKARLFGGSILQAYLSH